MGDLKHCLACAHSEVFLTVEEEEKTARNAIYLVSLIPAKLKNIGSVINILICYLLFFLVRTARGCL
jgi:hypothetical protein